MGTDSKRFVNTTVTCELATPCDVRSEHRRFPGSSLKLASGTAIVFSSGKVVIVGAKSEEEITAAVKELSEKLGPVKNTELRNVVGTVDVGARQNLVKLYNLLDRATYEPELFTGLTVKLHNGATCIIFHTGKVIVTGTHSFHECDVSINIIRDLLNKA